MIARDHLACNMLILRSIISTFVHDLLHEKAALRVPLAVTWLTVYRQLQMARRTCFREQYYTGTRGIILGQEDCRPRPGKTMCRIWSVFHQYFWIFVFVWAVSFEVVVNCVGWGPRILVTYKDYVILQVLRAFPAET